MDGKTRQLVLATLKEVHAAACSAVARDLDHLPPGERRVVQESMEEINACVHRQFAGTLQPETALERIAALVYGHPSPQAVLLMEQYAHHVNDLLCAARDRLSATGQHWDH